MWALWFWQTCFCLGSVLVVPAILLILVLNFRSDALLPLENVNLLLLLADSKKVNVKCFRDFSLGPWIGFRYHGEKNAHMWVNGEILEENSANWLTGTEYIQNF